MNSDLPDAHLYCCLQPPRPGGADLLNPYFQCTSLDAYGLLPILLELESHHHCIQSFSYSPNDFNPFHNYENICSVRLDFTCNHTIRQLITSTHALLYICFARNFKPFSKNIGFSTRKFTRNILYLMLESCKITGCFRNHFAFTTAEKSPNKKANPPKMGVCLNFNDDTKTFTWLCLNFHRTI